MNPTAADTGPTVTSGRSGIRTPFRRFFGFDLRTGIVLLTVTALLRILIVLGANATGSYQLVSVFFVVLIALPWIAFTRPGRRRIGFTRPKGGKAVVLAIGAGAAVCVATFALMTALFGHSIANPFVYIASSYAAIPQPLTDADRMIYFLIFAVINATFSPLGEEILYRGMSTEMLRTRLSGRATALVEAGAFALVHLAHFGIIFTAGGWEFLPIPAALWSGAMFLTGLIFAYARRASGSLLGAILSHSAYNLTMTTLIFSALGVI